ncbi:MAG: hypothetical protein GY794_12240 [bacterium]|nr:hypothetical protein [bacterium]
MTDRPEKTSETIIPTENPTIGQLHLLAKFRQDVNEFKFGVLRPRRDIAKDGTLDRMHAATAANASLTLREYAKTTREYLPLTAPIDPVNLSQHESNEAFEVNTLQEITHINMCA